VTGRVSFIGAGPGAADLITLRGARRIAEADVVVWAASLVDPACVRDHARPEAELVDSSRITHEDVMAIYRRAAAERLTVARVHSGDPALWGAVQEQYDACRRLGLEVEIVPGVSAFTAAAAVAGRELTVPEVAQSVILTRLEGGKTPMPDAEQVREFARHGTTMAVFLSAARTGALAEELRAGGYPEDTPVLVAYKVTWPDELILHTTLGELEATVKRHKLWRHTLFLVGKALQAKGTRSRLYHAGHFHTFRRADPEARRALRAGRTEPSGAGEGETERRPGGRGRWLRRATGFAASTATLDVDRWSPRTEPAPAPPTEADPATATTVLIRAAVHRPDRAGPGKTVRVRLADTDRADSNRAEPAGRLAVGNRRTAGQTGAGNDPAGAPATASDKPATARKSAAKGSTAKGAVGKASGATTPAAKGRNAGTRARRPKRGN
jgi:precorrin-4 C11-methyltransferase